MQLWVFTSPVGVKEGNSKPVMDARASPINK